ncbi:hypothetical protein GCM10022214_26520 [Actinomadura miaoliensis]|uniref:Uncharacterized protein n=1 Tax=Actinomadura miaoliensis TaxID=430685 RepID=A0ABP7VNU3_9ACTN
MDGTGVWALTHDRLIRVDTRTGRKTSTLTIHNAWHNRPVDLWVADGDLFLSVVADGTNDQPPVRVLG